MRSARAASFSTSARPGRGVGTWFAAPLLLGLAAAGPVARPAPPSLQVQIADAGPLSGAAPAPVLASPKPLVVLPAGLEPAPVPDPDVYGPNTAGGLKGASLAPAFFSQKAEFAGDGFTGKSSSEDTADRRRQPAAGFNLKVPVLQ